MNLRLILAIYAMMFASAPARADLVAENLLTPMPKGFKLGWSKIDSGLDYLEYVPAGETVENWTKLLTVQIFHKLGGLAPAKFAGKMALNWTSACSGGSTQILSETVENGYPILMQLQTCPLNPGSGQPESAMVKFIGGKDAFYVLQYAWRAEGGRDNITEATTVLSGPIVCDTREPAHPCPK
jgi:hypothetical protein